MRSLSNVLPILLERVIPLSLQHLPLVPLPLYSLMTSPLSHCLGILRVVAMLLNTFRYSSFVWALASVRAVFGILSGPGALCLCKFFMILLSYSIVKGMGRRGSRGGVRGVRTPPLVIKVLHFYCKTALSQRQSLRRCPLRMPFEKTLNPPLQEILDPRLMGILFSWSFSVQFCL